MKKFSASFIYSLSGSILPNGTVVTDDEGTILELLPFGHPEAISEPGQIAEGILVPGFVNSHCHLELSHLLNAFQEKTGLHGFVLDVVKNRNQVSKEVIMQAMERAEQDMINGGIVAVGDISNTDDSLIQKSKKNLYYYTFFEVFSLDAGKADAVIQKALELAHNFENHGLDGSVSPHAPYSLSKKLIQQLTEVCSGRIISLHNQETASEDEYFLLGTGNLARAFEKMGIPPSALRKTGMNSVKSTLPAFSSAQRLLLVHNTYSTKEDIHFAKSLFNHPEEQLFFCFCPLANLFIEGRLPNIPVFMEEGANICLGTDSLASNHQLSILHEMAAIHQRYPEISLETLLKWACSNGAKFLGLPFAGSLEKGKKPGINLIQGLENNRITPNTSVRRLI